MERWSGVSADVGVLSVGTAEMKVLMENTGWATDLKKFTFCTIHQFTEYTERSSVNKGL